MPVRIEGLWVALAAGGCVEYGLDRGEYRDSRPDGDSDVVVADACADLAVAVPATVQPLDECTASPDAADNPWDVVIEWQYFLDAGGAAAVAGMLTDDNVDGVVDERDDPDIVFASTYAATALDGAGGGPLFTVVIQPPGLAIGDLDRDGTADVVSASFDRFGAAYDAAGALLWSTAPRADLAVYFVSPVIADLDADGIPEVVLDRLVLDGRTGSVLSVLDEPSQEWRTAVVADLDRDGQSEIVLGDIVADAAGRTLWRAPLAGRGAIAAVVNADEDDDGELILVSGSEYVLMDTDGAVLVQAPIAGLDPGPPCVADFDGDGAPEIGIAAKSALSVLELDGSVVWTSSIYDPSGLAGCSAVDLDLDGAAELLYADHEDFRIYDGRTGAVRFTLPEHHSITGMEYPVVADVDHDGSAEIVLSSNSARWGGGVTVLGHRDGAWPRVPTVWPVHDYAVTNVRADGSVPTNPEPSWLVHNTFRAQPTLDQAARSELRIALTDVCVSACDGGDVHVSWQVSNLGTVASPADAKVTLYAVGDDGEQALASRQLPSLAPGEAPVGQRFVVPAEALAGQRLALEVENPDGCYDKPHRVTRTESVCP